MVSANEAINKMFQEAKLGLTQKWRKLHFQEGNKKASKHNCLLANYLNNEAEGARTLNLRIDSPML